MNSNNADVSLQFVGDISLNGLYTDPLYYSEVKDSLVSLDKKIADCDLRIGNWESPITSNKCFHPSKMPLLATTIEAFSLMKHFRFDMLNICNNHLVDCMDDGYITTKQVLGENGIHHFGLNQGESICTVSCKGLKIGFVSLIGKETNPKLSILKGVEAVYIDDPDVLKIISDKKQLVDVLIVSVHWGIEYIKYPNQTQIEFARSIIDAGANVFYGHHPHRMQGAEVYNKGAILYSMGNFLFSPLKGKEHIGWPKFCNHSCLYSVALSPNGEVKELSFSPISLRGVIPVLDLSRRAYKRQLKLNHFLTRPYVVQKLLRSIHSIYVWGVYIPIYFIRSRGGLISALSKLKLDHFRIVRSYFS